MLPYCDVHVLPINKINNKIKHKLIIFPFLNMLPNSIAQWVTERHLQICQSLLRISLGLFIIFTFTKNFLA